MPSTANHFIAEHGHKVMTEAMIAPPTEKHSNVSTWIYGKWLRNSSNNKYDSLAAFDLLQLQEYLLKAPRNSTHISILHPIHDTNWSKMHHSFFCFRHNWRWKARQCRAVDGAGDQPNAFQIRRSALCYSLFVKPKTQIESGIPAMRRVLASVSLNIRIWIAFLPMEFFIVTFLRPKTWHFFIGNLLEVPAKFQEQRPNSQCWSWTMAWFVYSTRFDLCEDLEWQPYCKRLLRLLSVWTQRLVVFKRLLLCVCKQHWLHDTTLLGFNCLLRCVYTTWLDACHFSAFAAALCVNATLLGFPAFAALDGCNFAYCLQRYVLSWYQRHTHLLQTIVCMRLWDQCSFIVFIWFACGICICESGFASVVFMGTLYTNVSYTVRVWYPCSKKKKKFQTDR